MSNGLKQVLGSLYFSQTTLTNINDHFIVFPAMILAGKLYFDAMSKIGENAAVSPVSRELGKSSTLPCPLALSLSLLG